MGVACVRGFCHNNIYSCILRPPRGRQLRSPPSSRTSAVHLTFHWSSARRVGGFAGGHLPSRAATVDGSYNGVRTGVVFASISRPLRLPSNRGVCTAGATPFAVFLRGRTPGRSRRTSRHPLADIVSPLPGRRHPLGAARLPPLARRHPLAGTRSPLPGRRHPLAATRSSLPGRRRPVAATHFASLASGDPRDATRSTPPIRRFPRGATYRQLPGASRSARSARRHPVAATHSPPSARRFPLDATRLPARAAPRGFALPAASWVDRCLLAMELPRGPQTSHQVPELQGGQLMLAGRRPLQLLLQQRRTLPASHSQYQLLRSLRLLHMRRLERMESASIVLMMRRLQVCCRLFHVEKCGDCAGDFLLSKEKDVGSLPAQLLTTKTWIPSCSPRPSSSRAFSTCHHVRSTSELFPC